MPLMDLPTEVYFYLCVTVLVLLVVALVMWLRRRAARRQQAAWDDFGRILGQVPRDHDGPRL